MGYLFWKPVYIPEELVSNLFIDTKMISLHSKPQKNEAYGQHFIIKVF